ncbi:MAG: hypothetical protein ABH833_02390 [Parcubacteria group bacterium]
MKYPQRVQFPKGKQKEFLFNIKRVLKWDTNEIANLVGLSTRTIRDWQREKLLMSLPAFNKLLNESGIPKPKGIKIRDPFWYTQDGGMRGYIALIKKYGHFPKNEKKRKEKWYEWWNTKGKYSHPLTVSSPISRPRKSKDLAEMTGILLGDGGITKNQVIVTLNCRDDKEYSEYVYTLMQKLFGVTPSVYRQEEASVNKIAISRVQLVKYCVENLGLVIGDKIRQQIDIPKWVKANQKYSIACLRGLVDTDGSIFLECHKIKGKKYCYQRLNFTSLSEPLRKSVFKIYTKLGLTPKLRNNRSVQIEKKEEIAYYFRTVDTSNPKHRRRFGGVG